MKLDYWITVRRRERFNLGYMLLGVAATTGILSHRQPMTGDMLLVLVAGSVLAALAIWFVAGRALPSRGPWRLRLVKWQAAFVLGSLAAIGQFLFMRML